MPASMVLPGDVEQSLLAALTANLTTLETTQFPSGIFVGAIGDKDIDDDDQLLLRMPCARQRYVGSAYKNEGDNQWLTYDASHIFEIWCAAEDLTSKEAQRTATTFVLGQVLPLIAGARLTLADTSLTEPVVIKNIAKLPDDIVGTIYIVTIEICGIAQFPGTLAAGSEDN
jgi:hypothetical protein